MSPNHEMIRVIFVDFYPLYYHLNKNIVICKKTYNITNDEMLPAVVDGMVSFSFSINFAKQYFRKHKLIRYHHFIFKCGVTKRRN